MLNLLPRDFEKEIVNFVDDFEPTPKDLLLSRLLEHGWEKGNIKAVRNYLLGIPAKLFFKDDKGHIYFAG
jgi:hypothetical protein